MRAFAGPDLAVRSRACRRFLLCSFGIPPEGAPRRPLPRIPHRQDEPSIVPIIGTAWCWKA